ncbi:MAG: hypothetical protein NC904_03370 [Candidatus Omnitrophica bacterium]|nr:hypothetical protein [Candidatus Omnitrophota bacterium]
MRKCIFKFCFLWLIILTTFALAQDKDIPIIEYLEFREVDIKDVLRQLAKQFNLNIVFSESVKGPITVQLHNIRLEDALDSIITVNGFSYIKKDNVIKVTTPEEAQREGRFTKLFKLNHADASKLKDTLKKVLSTEGTIEADIRSNSLIVTDMPAVINRIEEMLRELDQITPQVLIEARFVETSLNVSEALGINWTAKIVASGSKRPTTFPFNKWGSYKSMYPVPKYSTEIDSATGEVTVDSNFPFKGERIFFPQDTYQLGSFPMVETSQFAFGILDFTEFQSILNFIKTQQDAKLMANPRITTLNNQKAIIHVGKSVPVPKFERNSETGKWEITGWESESERIGVTLEVTPQISPDDHIRMKIKPEVSNIESWITIQGDQVRPITTTRTAETEVQIKDNQTVVIGGLIKDKSSHTVKKVPILGSIPILGAIFTYSAKDSEESPGEKTDLIIFVTARILKDTNEPLVGYKRGVLTSLPKPFKLELREVKIER